MNRNRHCNESVARFYELRPKQLLCWNSNFSRPYCNLLWSVDQLLGIGCYCFKDLRPSIFCIFYSFGKLGKYFLFSGWNLSLTRVHLVLIKTLLRPQSTMQYFWSHLGTQDIIIILLRHASLLDYFYLFGNFVIIFTCLLRWQRQYLVVLKSLNGSWIQTWWSARNHAMLIYLVMTSFIFAGSSAECSLPYACTILFGNCAIVPFILSSSNLCQFYRRWTSGKCLTYLVNILAGAAGQCKRNESRGVFYQSLKIIRLRFIYLFVSLAYTFKRHE